MEVRGCRPEMYDWSECVVSVLFDFKGRPCNTCVAKNHCKNTECKTFLRWCNEGTELPKPKGLTESQLIEKYPGSTKKQISHMRKTGKLRYTIWKNRCIYTHADEDMLTLKNRRPEHLLNTEQIIELTGITKQKLKWMLQYKNLRAEVKIDGRNYFGYKAVKEILQCV